MGSKHSCRKFTLDLCFEVLRPYLDMCMQHKTNTDQYVHTLLGKYILMAMLNVRRNVNIFTAMSTAITTLTRSLHGYHCECPTQLWSVI